MKKSKRCSHTWEHIGMVFEGIPRQKDFERLIEWAGVYICWKCGRKEKERPTGKIRSLPLAQFLKRLKERGDA